MEELLKLVFSNIYIVIIIVGFLFSVLRKAGGKGNQPNRMPTFGGGPSDRSQQRQEARQSQPPLSPETIPAQPQRAQSRTVQSAQPRPIARSETGRTASETFGGSMYTSAQQSVTGEGRSSDLRETSVLAKALEAQKLESLQPQSATTSKAKAAAATTASRGDSFHMPQGKDLRRAFVMAEVLGPPKSKRPNHRR